MRDTKNHLMIPYDAYCELKNKKYNLFKGIKNTKIEDLDTGVMFFDEYQEYIDPKRFEIENIIPAHALLPRFFWLENAEKLQDFRFVDNQGNKIDISFFLEKEMNLKNEYQLNQNQLDLIQNEIKKFS